MRYQPHHEQIHETDLQGSEILVRSADCEGREDESALGIMPSRKPESLGVHPKMQTIQDTPTSLPQHRKHMVQDCSASKPPVVVVQ